MTMTFQNFSAVPTGPRPSQRLGAIPNTRLFWLAWNEQGRTVRWLFSGARASAEYFEAPIFRYRRSRDWLPDAVFEQIMRKGFQEIEGGQPCGSTSATDCR
jgi:hypothetical protein